MREKLMKILREDGLTIGILILVLGAWLILRTPGDQYQTVDDFLTELKQGQPTTVEFYSNRCSICLTSKPKVDRLEQEISPQARVIRLDVSKEPGQSLTRQWRVTGVPTFFVFDGAGTVVYRRAGAPDIEDLRDSVEALSSTPQE